MGWFDWLFARRNTKIEDKKISISKKKVNPVLTEIVKEGVEIIIEKEMEEATIELAKFEDG